MKSGNLVKYRVMGKQKPVIQKEFILFNICFLLNVVDVYMSLFVKITFGRTIMIKLITISFFALGLFMCIIREHTMSMTKKENAKLKLKKKLKNFFLSEGFCEYIITIAATVLGVTLAIIFTNYDTDRKDCKDTIEFLEIFDEELLTKEETILALWGLMDMTDRESAADGIKEMTFSPMLPLEVILNNEPYVSTLSGSTYSALLIKRTALDMMQKKLVNASSRFDVEGCLLGIMQNMNFIHSVVEIELLYQNNDINEQEVEKRIEELYNDEAQEYRELIMEMTDGLEDSEWKSQMQKMLKSMED